MRPAPFGPVEDAVMADIHGEMILLHRVGQVRRDVQRRLGLADAGDVVILAFHREQGDVGDRARIDPRAAMHELALGQAVLLEHLLDRLEVEFGGHVADRAIFVVELLGRLGAVVVALHQMPEHVPMAHQVAAQVHRHEAGKLHEPRIDLPPGARIAERHGGDDILPEPAQRALLSEVVDRGRSLARIDRAAHHRQRAGTRGVLFRRHEGRRRQARHRRLAHGQHVRAGPHMLQPSDQIVDIVVEIEIAVRKGDVPRVGPVGDVDVVIGQQPCDRATQERGEMAGHRRDHQQLGVAFAALAHEMTELAEGLARLDRLADRHFLAVDHRRRQIEGRLSTRRCSMSEHVEGMRKQGAAAEIGERIGRVLQDLHARRGDCTRAGQQISLNFVSAIEHAIPAFICPPYRPTVSMLRCNIAHPASPPAKIA